MNPQTEAPATNPRSRATTMRLAIALTMVIAGTLLTVLPAAATPNANPDDPIYWADQMGGQCWRHVDNKNDNGHGSIKVDAQGDEYIELKTPPISLVYRVLIIRAAEQPVTDGDIDEVTEWPTVGPAYYADDHSAILSWIVCKVSTASTTTTTSTAVPSTTTSSTTSTTVPSTTTSSTTSTTVPSTTTTTTGVPTTTGAPTTVPEGPIVSLPIPPTTEPGADATSTTVNPFVATSTDDTPTSVLAKTSTRSASSSSSTSLTRSAGGKALAYTGGVQGVTTALGLGLLAAGALLVAVERRRKR